MGKLGKPDKRDKRDKRYTVVRRRRKLPWFLVACLLMVIGFKWVSERVLPTGASAPAAARSAEAGAVSSQSTDW